MGKVKSLKNNIEKVQEIVGKKDGIENLKEKLKTETESILNSLKDENELTKLYNYLDESLKLREIDTFDEILR